MGVVSTSSAAALPVQPRAWETRSRILDAAVACLADVGYGGTTTTVILERAGVSRGSLLHQFPSKDELLVAAVQHLAEARTGELIADPPHHVHSDTIGRAVQTLWASLHGPLFTATVELWVAARTNPVLREVLRPEEHRLGLVIREAMAAVFGPEAAAHPRFRELCSVLWSSMRGVALTYTFEPRDPHVDPHLDAWKNLARSYLQPVSSPASMELSVGQGGDVPGASS